MNIFSIFVYTIIYCRLAIPLYHKFNNHIERNQRNFIYIFKDQKILKYIFKDQKIPRYILDFFARFVIRQIKIIMVI